MTRGIQLYFGDHWLVFRGPAFDAELHRHHAAQWAFALSGSLSADLPGGCVLAGPGLFVPPNCEHAFHAHSDVVMVYWEPEHSAYAAFAAGEEVLVARRAQSPEPLLPVLTPASAKALAYGCLGQHASEEQGRAPLDGRMVAARDWIGKHLEHPVDLASAAGSVHVSAAHLARLFRTECGTTFRAYVRWRRLLRAVEMALAGGTLTEAAHASGFSDSAHLSRTFREMFGVPPQFLFGRREALQAEIVQSPPNP